MFEDRQMQISSLFYISQNKRKGITEHEKFLTVIFNAFNTKWTSMILFDLIVWSDFLLEISLHSRSIFNIHKITIIFHFFRITQLINFLENNFFRNLNSIYHDLSISVYVITQLHFCFIH